MTPHPTNPEQPDTQPTSPDIPAGQEEHVAAVVEEGLSHDERGDTEKGKEKEEEKSGSVELEAERVDMKYDNERGQEFFHLDLPYNETSQELLRNPEIISQLKRFIGAHAFMEGNELTIYVDQGEGQPMQRRVLGEMREITNPQNPNETIRESVYTLYKGNTLGGRKIIKAAKFVGVANSLNPGKSIEGIEWENNDQLANTRANTIQRVWTEKLGLPSSLLSDREYVVYGENENIPGGITYEDSPGVFVYPTARATTKKYEHRETRFGQRSIDRESDFRGVGDIQQRVSLNGIDATPAEVARDYYSYVMDEGVARLMSTMSPGDEKVVSFEGSHYKYKRGEKTIEVTKVDEQEQPLDGQSTYVYGDIRGQKLFGTLSGGRILVDYKAEDRDLYGKKEYEQMVSEREAEESFVAEKYQWMIGITREHVRALGESADPVSQFAVSE